MAGVHNVRGNHWIAYACCRTATHVDVTVYSSTSADEVATAAQLTTLLESAGWPVTRVRHSHTPLQHNGHDCALYAVLFVMHALATGSAPHSAPVTTAMVEVLRA